MFIDSRADRIEAMCGLRSAACDLRTPGRRLRLRLRLRLRIMR
jgi:hypothetical protein